MSNEIDIESFVCPKPSEILNPVIPEGLESLLRILKFFGVCPISRNDIAFERFRIKIFSFSTFICFTVSVFITAVVCSHYVGTYLQIPPYTRILETFKSIAVVYGIENSTAVLLNYLLLGFYLSLPGSIMHNIASGWLQSRQLVSFLNNWRTFHSDFDKTFGPHFNGERPVAARKKTWYSDVRIVLIYVGPAVFFILLAETIGSPDEVNFSDGHNIFVQLISMTGLISMEYLDDTKIKYLFSTVINAYHLVNTGVREAASNASLDQKSIKELRQLILRIRGQCSLLSNCIAQRQLFLVAQCIAYSTLCIYFIASLPWWEKTFTYMLPLWLYFSSSTLIRIYLKGSEAEKITNSEKDLAHTIAMIEISTSDLATLHELKFAHDIISQSPIQIHFGSILIYSRRVVLMVTTQVVTYLIVLLQFAQK